MTRLNAWLSSLFAVVAILSLPGRAGAVEHEDEWITAMIKMEMWTAPGVPSTAIYVDTLDGRVVLSGKVEAQGEREAAEKVARTIAGVVDVRNVVEIVPRDEKKVVARADKEVATSVRKALASERSLAGTQIAVASVSNGVVVLSGEARTFSEHLVAVEAARLVPGVRTVVTQVKSPREPKDEEFADDRAMRAGRDAFITTAVKLRLFADRAVPAREVKVDSRYGMVVLFGTVPTETAKAAAGRDAARVSGVDRVLNDLQVVPAASRTVVAATDEVLRLSVKKALAARAQMKRVDASVKNAVVRLTGTVGSVPAKLRATLVAGATPGVDSVENDLLVKHD